jgi:cell division protein FtsW
MTNYNPSYFAKNTINPKSRYDWFLVFLIFIICTFGFTFLASSLSPSPSLYFKDLSKQILIGGVLGSIGAFFLARLDYHKILKFRWIFLWINYLMLGFLAIFGVAISFFKVPFETIESLTKFLPARPIFRNGAVRWIEWYFKELPQVQPSELAKIVLLIFVAGEIGRIKKTHENSEITDWQSVKNVFGLCGGMCGLILLQPDLGTVIMIAVILASSFWVAKISRKIMTGLVIVAMVVTGFAVITQPYRIARILSTTDSKETSQQVANNKEAVSQGGLLGKGYGNSYGKNDYSSYQIYEPTTDSIIAIIAEEVGFVGILVLLFLYFLMFWRILDIAYFAPDLEGKILAIGIVTWIIFQVFMNMSGMTGLIPMKGLPLPFVSEGGTSLLILLLSMGVVLNISSQSVKN